MDPALVKVAYNVACPKLNGNTLITLCSANDVGQSVDPFTTAFSGMSGYLGHACKRELLRYGNKYELKNKVLKNNTMNANLRIV